jgi:hypothetical protein
MAKTDTTTVIRRLLDDDYIHEQMSIAGAGARDAYRRARRLPPERAVQDKDVYERLRRSVSGLSEATRRALGKPEPDPPSRRIGVRLLVLIATGAAVAWASKAHRRNQGVTVADAPRTV